MAPTQGSKTKTEHSDYIILIKTKYIEQYLQLDSLLQVINRCTNHEHNK